jgi:hypothetical protein
MNETSAPKSLNKVFARAENELKPLLKPPTSDRDDPQSFTLIPTEGAELFEDLKSLRSKALAKKEEVDVSMAEVQSLEGCVLPFCFVYFLRI